MIGGNRFCQWVEIRWDVGESEGTAFGNGIGWDERESDMNVRCLDGVKWVRNGKGIGCEWDGT